MKIAYRSAAILLLLFCGGHTVGTLAGRSPSPEADPVLTAMRTVRFDFNGVERTMFEIFFAHALLVSVFLLLSVLLAWTLSAVEPERWRPMAPIAWGLALAQGVAAFLTWRYFFVGPAVLTTIAAMLVTGAALRGSMRDAR